LDACSGEFTFMGLFGKGVLGSKSLGFSTNMN